MPQPFVAVGLPPLAAMVGGELPLLQELAELAVAFQASPPSAQLTSLHPDPGLSLGHWQAWPGSDAAAPPHVAFSVGESDAPESFGLGWFSYPGPSSFDPDLHPDFDLEHVPVPEA